MFESVDEAATHVSAVLGSNGSIDEPLSSSHCVEEELDRLQPITIAVIDKAPWGGSHVSGLEEAESSPPGSPQDSLSSNRLLANVRGHLSDVERRSSCARTCQYDAAVVHLEVLLRVFARNVPRS